MGNYPLKANNRNTRRDRERDPKQTIQALERHHRHCSVAIMYSLPTSTPSRQMPTS